MLTQADIDNMRNTLKAGVQVVTAPQLFETPRDLAERMANLIFEPSNNNGLRSWEANSFNILEPSGGTGQLVGACGTSWHPGGSMTIVEINQRLASRLEHEFPLSHVHCIDFLDFDPDTLPIGETGERVTFDRIIMNPPFIKGSDIKHISHALAMLKQGGRLAAICADGPRQRDILKTAAEDSGGFYESLPAGTFKDKGTNVNTALLVIEG